MARMTSKYPGTCRDCGDRFAAGTLIDYTKAAPRGRKAAHADCNAVADGGGEVYEIRTSEGTFYRNRNGICEDAPCCGCCTF